MAQILIHSLADLDRFAAMLAPILAECDYPALYLIGPLGCGKTALTSRICDHWPGLEQAEISSPSFTVCNIYRGRPDILHCDLYRSHYLPEEIREFVDAGNCQLIVEWAEYMQMAGVAHLDISFNVGNDSRLLDFAATGKNAELALDLIHKRWQNQA